MDSRHLNPFDVPGFLGLGAWHLEILPSLWSPRNGTLKPFKWPYKWVNGVISPWGPKFIMFPIHSTDASLVFYFLTLPTCSLELSLWELCYPTFWLRPEDWHFLSRRIPLTTISNGVPGIPPSEACLTGSPFVTPCLLAFRWWRQGASGNDGWDMQHWEVLQWTNWSSDGLLWCFEVGIQKPKKSGNCSSLHEQKDMFCLNWIDVDGLTSPG